MVATAQNKELKELDALKASVFLVLVTCSRGKEFGVQGIWFRV